MAKKILCEKDIDDAIFLREQKRWTIQRIADKFGVSTSCIDYHFLQQGVEILNQIPKLQPIPAEPVTVYRSGRPVRRFAKWEDDLIIEKERAGVPMMTIGKMLQRRAHVIRARLQTLARRAERQEQLARRPKQQNLFSQTATA